MSTRRMKGAWWIDLRFKGQRIRRKSPVDTKRGAEEYERQLRLELLEGKGADRKGGAPTTETKKSKVPTLATFAEEFQRTYVQSNNKPSEIETKKMIFKTHLVPAFGTLTLDQIDGRAIEAYKATKLAEPLKAKTVNNHLTVLRKLLSLAVEWRIITHVPVVKWLKTPEPDVDFLDFGEAPRLIAGADDEWRTMILVGLRTGLRLGELLALRWDDVDLVAKKIVVRRAVARGIVGTPKSGKTREVPLSGDALAELNRHRHLKGEFVFSDEKGAMLVKTACKWPLWRACKRAGLRRIGWHVLRHTFASHLAMRGVPLKVIQELLGHSTIEMTMRYAHLAPAVHQNAVALLDAPVPAGHLMGTERAAGSSQSQNG